MSNPKNEDDELVSKVMLESASLGGQASGAAIGFAIGGPVGAAMGAITGGIVQISADSLRRRISSRQTTRIGILLNSTKNTLSARLMNGETRRQDDFFEKNNGAYSHYEEMLEDLLRAVTETIEERKIPFMANMLARFILSDDYQVYKMRDLIRRVEDLSFLQLKLLVITVDESAKQKNRLIWIGNKTHERRALDLVLENNRLRSLNVTEPQNLNEFDDENSGPSPQPSYLGREIYELMELSKIPAKEIADLRSELTDLDICR